LLWFNCNDLISVVVTTCLRVANYEQKFYISSLYVQSALQLCLGLELGPIATAFRVPVKVRLGLGLRLELKMTVVVRQDFWTSDAREATTRAPTPGDPNTYPQKFQHGVVMKPQPTGALFLQVSLLSQQTNKT